MQTKTTDQSTDQPTACGRGPCAGRDHGPTDYETLARRCPGLSIADAVDTDLADVLRQYHHHVWGGEGVLPLKYKYLMALATAVTGREKQRALLETRKALAHGATAEEVRETLALGLWLAGSPRLVDVVGPVERMLENREGAGPGDAEAAEANEEARGRQILEETCFRCGASEADAVLFPCRHQGRSQWVCVRCLPPLIHG